VLEEGIQALLAERDFQQNEYNDVDCDQNVINQRSSCPTNFRISYGKHIIFILFKR
jgi:hypothetical protein